MGLPATLDASEIEVYADQGEYVILACQRAKEWLTQAVEHGDIEGLVNLKSQAEAIRVYTAQKQLGHDAEVAAAEIVRRAERGLGLAIRRGQEAGEVTRRGPTTGASVYQTDVRRLAEIVPEHEWKGNGAGIRDLTDDVTDEQFEQAIEEAKAENNLSRANVVRKARGQQTDRPATQRVDEIRTLAARGMNSPQIARELGVGEQQIRSIARANNVAIPADDVIGNARRIDSNRIVAGTVAQIDGIDGLFNLIDYTALDGEQLQGWIRSLSGAIRSLTTLKRNLEKEQTSRGQR